MLCCEMYHISRAVAEANTWVYSEEPRCLRSPFEAHWRRKARERDEHAPVRVHLHGALPTYTRLTYELGENQEMQRFD